MSKQFEVNNAMEAFLPFCHDDHCKTWMDLHYLLLPFVLVIYEGVPGIRPQVTPD